MAVAVALVITSLSAAPSGAQTAPKRGGKLTFSFTSDVPRNYDNLYITGVTSDGWNTGALYDYLVHVDEATGKVIPRFATSVTTTDNRVWTIKLRPKLVFSDGTKFDAQAIKYNWDRMANPANGTSCNTIVTLKSWKVTDPLTIAATLTLPSSVFPYQLQSCIGMIGSPTAMEALGSNFGLKPVAAGPFMLKEWVRGNRTTFVRNPKYWDSPRPYVDTLELKVIVDAKQKADALSTGQIDLLAYGGIQPDYIKFDKNKKYQSTKANISGGIGVVMQTLSPPFDDSNARLALVNGLDFKDLNIASYGSTEEMIASSFFPKTSPFYDPSIRQSQGNLVKAQQYVDKYVASHDGKPLRISLTSAVAVLANAAPVQQQLSRLKNVQLSIDAVTSAEALRRQAAGEYQLFLGGPGSSTNPNPAQQLYNVYHSPPAKQYFNSKVNQLTKQLLAIPITDVARQKPLIKQILTIAYVQDPSWVPFVRAVRTTYSRPGLVKGLTTFAGGTPDWASIWVNRG